MPIQIQYRRGTAQEWFNANPVLAAGEPGYETTDPGRFKIGDGVRAWNSLPYSSGLPAPILPTFSAQGQLSVSTGKQRFYLDRAGTLSVLRASVGTASSSGSVTIQLLKNGSLADSISIAAGSFTAKKSISISVVEDDYLTVNISSAGTSATDLTVEISITA